MRWILLIAAIAGFAIAFTTTSPSLMGFGLILGCGGFLCFAFAFAAARIAQTSQPEAAMIVDPEISALRAKANLAKSAPRTPVAPPDRGVEALSDRNA